MTPAQLARLIALPLHWRRKLAACEGPGREIIWSDANGTRVGSVREGPDPGWPIMDWNYPGEPPCHRHAWAPCNPLEWLRVATPEGTEPRLEDGMWCFWSDTSDGESYKEDRSYETKDPIDAALTAMEAQP